MTSRFKVLVVDDDAAWLEEVDSLLSSANYDVERACSFNVARTKLLSTTYAAIIIDLELEMSGTLQKAFEGFGLLNGIQFLEMLSRRQCKAIVLSAYGDVEWMRQAFKRGAYDFIRKQDFERDTFLDVVREAVQLWASHCDVMPQRTLTPEEDKEYRRLARQFLRSQSIQFDVPEDAVNPWEEQSE